MMRRYHTGLTLIASISTILLLLWGLDLSQSIAQEQPAGPYRADVSVWADGPCLNELQGISAINHRHADTCVIVFRSDHGMLIWKHNTHPGNRDIDPIRLSRLTDDPSVAGCVVLVTFGASHGADEDQRGISDG